MIRRLLLIGCMLVAQSILDARSVLMDPRPAQVGFAQKVAAYVNGVHSKTPKDGVGQVLSKAVFLTSQATMKSVAAILNELGPHLIRDKTVAEQEACSASLIKILVPIVTQFEKALFNGVRTIERSLEYWQYQEMHPVSYYLHKSPLKYFTFDQREEVAGKIQTLKTMREQHFELLGRINIHLSSFDGQIAVQDQYAWIQKLCRVLFAYDETLHVAQDAEIFPLLYEATNIVSQYKTRMHERLKTYQIPSLLARRWMELTTAAAAATYGGWYCYTHQETLTRFYHDVEEGCGVVKEIVVGKRDNTAVDEEYKRLLARFAGDAQGGDEGEVQRLNEEREQIQTMMKNSKIERSEVAQRAMKFFSDVGVTGGRIVVEDFAEIGHAFGEGENQPGLIERGARYFVPGAGSVRRGMGNAAGTLSRSKKQKSGAAAAASSSSSSSSAPEASSSKEELPFTVSEALPEAYDWLKLWVNLQTVEHPRIWGLIRSAPFTITLSFIAWKAGKMLYRRHTKAPDCEPIRIALVDIALILNVYGDASPEEMDASDFGRLAYLAHKLELDVAFIPKQYRESFLIEIGLLRTSSLNAQQKMTVINLMYKKYPFLAFQGMITA